MKHNKNGYSILIALFIIGFLLVLTAGVYQLVLSELQDNRGRGNYLKAQYAAEGAMEMALLKIKQIGYGVSDEIPLDINARSIVLGKIGAPTSEFKPANDALISYMIDTKAVSYSGAIAPSEHSIIPLFYLDRDGNEFKSSNLSLSSTLGGSDIAWSIVGESFGLSGEGVFDTTTLGNYKSVQDGQLQFEKKSVGDFLASSNNNYLILFNSNGNSEVSFSLQTSGSGGFTKPIGEIYASGKVGSYKQNIKVTLDNTTYLNLLKYSLFSNQ